MAVYYKFKSARDYDSIPIDGHFISVANLKERIFESKHLGRGTDFDLMVSNAQTDEEYVDEATLIPKNTSVLVRRIPGRPWKPIVTQENETRSVEDKVEEMSQTKSGAVSVADPSSMKFPEESEWDEFGNDLYAIPEVVPSLLSNAAPNVPSSQVDEESKIKALVDTPALDWQRQPQDNFGPGRGFGRGMSGRMFAGRAFGRGGYDRKTPPPGYVCHRCKVPGHLIQHCPTNGDPNYDIKRVKPPTGIPRSMLMATPDGSYALPSGAVAVLKPNEAAFEKEIEGLPSTRQVTDLPPELSCPLCKEVMKDAVLTSKCCFSSFCDKCIRDYIISKSMCVCGFANILADDLLPNKTLRQTISRFMESATSSADNAGSLVQAQDMESARSLPPKVPSPTLSATKEAHTLPPSQPVSEVKEVVENGQEVVETKTSREKSAKIAEKSAVTPESMGAKEPTSQESAPPVEEAHEKVLSSEQGKKKKKKKTRATGNAVAEAQWRSFQDMGIENCMGMPLAPGAYNPYLTGMPWGMDGFMGPFPGAMPLMSYPQGPFDLPFGVLPQDPFAGQGYMMPPPMVPQRDLSELCMGGLNKNAGPPPHMTREEFEARKAELRRKHINENERDRCRDREASKDHSGAETSLKPKPKLMSQAAVVDRAERGRSPIRTKSPMRPLSSARESLRRTPSPPPRAPKRKHEEEGEIMAKPWPEPKQKASVFSRISFPDSNKDGGSKKRKSSELPNGIKDSIQPSCRSSSSRDEPKQLRSSQLEEASKKNACDYESSEEEYHFKRRPSSWHGEGEDEARSLRSTRERTREQDYERSKRR